MKIIFTSAFVLFSLFSFGGGNVHSSRSSVEKTFYSDIRRMPDLNFQAILRNQSPWQNFLIRNGDWWVQFNEDSRKPHRAFGRPIPVSGTNAVDCAKNFITNELSDFRIPFNDLVLAGNPNTEKYHYVNFYQTYQGLKVLDSRLTVKMTPDFKVVLFGADVYDNIQISVTPSISFSNAESYASSGINETVLSVTSEPALSILPVPVNRSVEFHLVYTVTVNTIDDEGIPAEYYSLVDAVTGDVLYRQNQVVHFHGENENKMGPGTIAEVQAEATVYLINPFVPSTVVNLPNLDVTAGSTNFVTDANGYVNTGMTAPVSGTLSLSGLWSTVFTSNVTPSFTTTLNAGLNTLSFDTDATIQENSAFYHVNIVHDFMKAAMPSFTGMDFSLPTNVDVTGTCNAFYNGSSINFYTAGGGCTSFANVADVVYHEYGHGINDNYYSDNGNFFMNGAMGEGYADFWAYAISESPVVGYGTDQADPNAFIRRYDVNRKVYPVNIVGEVHADGEIIAGAWWDTYLNLGNDMNLTLQLFVEAYAGFQATTFNGNEGQAFTDVLIDALQADDTDGDLTNGTPNGQAIVDAFHLHGISLISNADLAHTPVASSPENVTIPVSATLTLNFPYTNYLNAVKCFYRVNNGTYTSIAMVNTTGNQYAGDIPAQPIGTVVSYYVGAEDIHGYVTAVKPTGASEADPTLPYFILVGYTLEMTDDVGDFVNELGNWTTSLSTDNATTGLWASGVPIGSFSDPSDTSTAVQPYYQHTPGGDICFYTGNANTTADGIGTNDVDAGHTTLQSATIDLSSYVNPTITYWRWYTNSPSSGANPNADWWQVYLSNDNGSTWVPVENTKTTDQRWRKNAFRVNDYLTPTSTMKMKFIASDSIRAGQNLDGGSLVEAALDDIQIWENADPDAVQENVNDGMQINIVPNPATENVVIIYEMPEAGNITISLSDITGKNILSENVSVQPGLNRKMLSLDQYESGIYHVTISYDNNTYIRKLVVTR